jgi:hypothetical protein
MVYSPGGNNAHVGHPLPHQLNIFPTNGFIGVAAFGFALRCIAVLMVPEFRPGHIVQTSGNQESQYFQAQLASA